MSDSSGRDTDIQLPCMGPPLYVTRFHNALGVICPSTWNVLGRNGEAIRSLCYQPVYFHHARLQDMACAIQYNMRYLALCNELLRVTTTRTSCVACQYSSPLCPDCSL